MSAPRLALLVVLALLGFAGNSLLCRLALRSGDIDPAGFTALRIGSGALVLWLCAQFAARSPAPSADAAPGRGDWGSALALFAYAAAFSYAYLGLTAATGALLLPGVASPPLLNAALMLGAGVAWGLYSLRGRDGRDPLRTTAGNFLRALPLAAGLALLGFRGLHFGREGVLAALASGAIASGLGYALWYAALPSLRASSAGILQLSVPVLAALGGIVLLGEPLGWRFALAAVLTLGGVALATLKAR
jgi:drug/metabolite transporter (DMT)-like permease